MQFNQQTLNRRNVSLKESLQNIKKRLNKKRNDVIKNVEDNAKSFVAKE